ncbi:MAG: caspase family protein [Prevotella sp.]|nr:caspase family protein [Prevotella sp.]
MKKILTLLVLTALLPLSVLSQTTYVLSTGVSNYGRPGVNLRNTTKDAKAFGALFKQQKNTKVSVVTSSNATKANIMKHLDAIQMLAKPEDKVVFFFSGHGDTDCFIAYDGGFRYSDFIDKLRQMNTNKVFVFIDACLSGSVQNTTSEYQWTGGKGDAVSFMMSSRASEYSYENQWLDNGYFTQALLLALRGKADTDSNRQVTLMEAFKYVHKDVTNRVSEQHPQLIANKSLYDEVIASW